MALLPIGAIIFIHYIVKAVKIVVNTNDIKDFDFILINKAFRIRLERANAQHCIAAMGADTHKSAVNH